MSEIFLGFNLTGWAWMLMLIVAIFNLFFTRKMPFPLFFWLPWVIYLVGYLIYDFSFIGLQLTLQYILPVLIGIVASGFLYSEDEVEWLFRWFLRLCSILFLMVIYGYLFRAGNTPAPAATPMLLTVALSILCALYFTTRRLLYLILCVMIFLVPVLNMTRMGIAAMAAIFIFHSSNRDIFRKIGFAILGLLVFLIVFSTERFQEKTFYTGRGTVRDLTINYYDNPNIRTSGRRSWKNALEPGLEAAPIWGNGPRADNQMLIEVTGLKAGEAHNDYMSVRYNYGYFGLVLLMSGFLFTFISLFRTSQYASDNNYFWLITVSTMTLFISFLLFMYSDNILKYTIFFPNYFFALIGIIYSLRKDEMAKEYLWIN